MTERRAVDCRHRPGSLTGKLLACVALVACLALGAVGLILPIVPGLVFLAIGVLIAARHFPALGSRLRRHPALGAHLSRADRYLDLPIARKLQVAGLVCVKLVLDALDVVARLLSKALGGRAAPR